MVKEKTKTISIKLSPLDLLHYRLCARFRDLDYGLYAFMINEVTSVLAEMPDDILEQLIESDFLVEKKDEVEEVAQ
tara:strand:+ start:2908 stop:3135 length:228 start_codon:yes stop_codon:yes gene_type:complete